MFIAAKAHRRHARVMQPGNADAAEDDCAGDRANPSDVLAAHDEQRRSRPHNADQQRQQDQRPVELHRNRQAQRELAGVVHRPGADAIHHGATGEPGKPRVAACIPDPLGEIARGVSGDNRDRNR